MDDVLMPEGCSCVWCSIPAHAPPRVYILAADETERSFNGYLATLTLLRCGQTPHSREQLFGHML